jgi:hypothetical protein
MEVVGIMNTTTKIICEKADVCKCTNCYHIKQHEPETQISMGREIGLECTNPSFCIQTPEHVKCIPVKEK